MKYIIDIPDDRIRDFVGSTHLLMPYIVAGHKGHYDTELELTPHTEPDRKAIEDEVWEFARKMVSTSGTEVSEMWGCATNFGEVMHNTTYSEAKAKYEAWLKQKDEIHVGDEVEYKGITNRVVVVTEIDNDMFDGVDVDGIVYANRSVKHWKKTGRHFPEVAELLEKMRGEKDG